MYKSQMSKFESSQVWKTTKIVEKTSEQVPENEKKNFSLKLSKNFWKMQKSTNDVAINWSIKR